MIESRRNVALNYGKQEAQRTSTGLKKVTLTCILPAFRVNVVRVGVIVVAVRLVLFAYAVFPLPKN